MHDIQTDIESRDDIILALAPEEQQIILRALRQKVLRYRSTDRDYAQRIHALYSRIEAVQQINKRGIQP